MLNDSINQSINEDLEESIAIVTAVAESCQGIDDVPPLGRAHDHKPHNLSSRPDDESRQSATPLLTSSMDRHFRLPGDQLLRPCGDSASRPGGSVQTDFYPHIRSAYPSL